MSSSPLSSSRPTGARYHTLVRPAQDKRNQQIEHHLANFNDTVNDKFDPELTKRSESTPRAVARYFTRHALLPVLGPIAFLVQEGKRESRIKQINNKVQHKDSHDGYPYGIEERRFLTRKGAENYVAKKHAKLNASMTEWEQALMRHPRPDTYVCHDGLFQIPVRTAPKVVTIIKTNRPFDAVNLFRDAQRYQPEVQNAPAKKPNLLTRVANLLKPKKAEDQQLLKEEDLGTLKPDDFDYLQDDSRSFGSDDETSTL